MKDKRCRPWLSVIVGGESLVSHAGGSLLVATARGVGLSRELSVRLGPVAAAVGDPRPGQDRVGSGGIKDHRTLDMKDRG